MTEFLSDAWVAALDTRYADSPGSAPAPVTVQYDVTMADQVRTYHLVLGPDRDRAIAGPAPDPDVTFSMDEATAHQISAGTLSTQRVQELTVEIEQRAKKGEHALDALMMSLDDELDAGIEALQHRMRAT